MQLIQESATALKKDVSGKAHSLAVAMAYAWPVRFGKSMFIAVILTVNNYVKTTSLSLQLLKYKTIKY